MEFVEFLSKAQRECPWLFSKDIPARDNCRLLDEMRAVFLSWEHLGKVQTETKDKASEADFVSNV